MAPMSLGQDEPWRPAAKRSRNPVHHPSSVQGNSVRVPSRPQGDRPPPPAGEVKTLIFLPLLEGGGVGVSERRGADGTFLRHAPILDSATLRLPSATRRDARPCVSSRAGTADPFAA